MYHAKIWDEDKLDIRSSYSSSKYGSIISKDKKEDKAYHEQKYGQKESSLSLDYARKEEEKEKEEKKEDIFSNLADEEKKEEKLKDEEIPFKAAKQIFSERKQEEPKKVEKKSETKTIEDAIQKAIKSEKDVIIMD